jgi:hypothetical protein
LTNIKNQIIFSKNEVGINQNEMRNKIKNNKEDDKYEIIKIYYEDIINFLDLCIINYNIQNETLYYELLKILKNEEIKNYDLKNNLKINELDFIDSLKKKNLIFEKLNQLNYLNYIYDNDDNIIFNNNNNIFIEYFNLFQKKQNLKEKLFKIKNALSEVNQSLKLLG